MSLTEDVLTEGPIGAALKGIGKGIAKAAKAVGNRSDKLSAEGTLDSKYKNYTIVAFDKTKKISKAQKAETFKDADKAAINLSKDSNTMFVRVFTEPDFNKLKGELSSNKDPESLLCVYKDGKAATDPKYNRIKEVANNILVAAKDNKIKSTDIDINAAETETKPETKEVKSAEEQKPEVAATEVNTEEKPNVETATETSIEGEIKKANNLDAANKAKKVLGTIRKAGINTELFTKPSKKAGKKIVDLDKIKQLSNDLQIALGESLDSDEDIEIDE